MHERARARRHPRACPGWSARARAAGGRRPALARRRAGSVTIALACRLPSVHPIVGSPVRFQPRLTSAPAAISLTEASGGLAHRSARHPPRRRAASARSALPSLAWTRTRLRGRRPDARLLEQVGDRVVAQRLARRAAARCVAARSRAGSSSSEPRRDSGRPVPGSRGFRTATSVPGESPSVGEPLQLRAAEAIDAVVDRTPYQLVGEVVRGTWSGSSPRIPLRVARERPARAAVERRGPGQPAARTVPATAASSRRVTAPAQAATGAGARRRRRAGLRSSPAACSAHRVRDLHRRSRAGRATPRQQQGVPSVSSPIDEASSAGVGTGRAEDELAHLLGAEIAEHDSRDRVEAREVGERVADSAATARRDPDRRRGRRGGLRRDWAAV